MHHKIVNRTKSLSFCPRTTFGEKKKQLFAGDTCCYSLCCGATGIIRCRKAHGRGRLKSQLPVGRPVDGNRAADRTTPSLRAGGAGLTKTKGPCAQYSLTSTDPPTVTIEPAPFRASGSISCFACSGHSYSAAGRGCGRKGGAEGQRWRAVPSDFLKTEFRG
jgi:hypothetical protein